MLGHPRTKKLYWEYVIFSIFQNSQTSKSMFSSFEIQDFETWKTEQFWFSLKFSKGKHKGKKQRDKTMENINGNTMENTKGNTWSVFTKRTHNDFPCGYDKSQRLLTRNSEKKKVRVNLQKMLFEIIENVHFIHVFHWFSSRVCKK